MGEEGEWANGREERENLTGEAEGEAEGEEIGEVTKEEKGEEWYSCVDSRLLR